MLSIQAVRCLPRLRAPDINAFRLSCSVLFCSPAVLDPRVGHAMDVLASVSKVYYYYFSAVAAERDCSSYAPPAPPAVCRYLLPAGRSAANPALLLSNDGTDRRTDA